MVEGRESAKQSSVLDGGSFKTTVALAEGRASEIRCNLAMATLEVNPVCVCVCVCVCVPRAGQSSVCVCVRVCVFPEQGKAHPLLPASVLNLWMHSLSQGVRGFPSTSLVFISCPQHQLANESYVSFTMFLPAPQKMSFVLRSS